MNDDVTRTPLQECPHCGYKIDSHGMTTGSEKHTPGPGDFSVCLACAGISRYGASFKMIPTSIDDPEMDDESRMEIARAISGIEHLRRVTPHWPQGDRRRTAG
jgi:hypothetical protein